MGGNPSTNMGKDKRSSRPSSRGPRRRRRHLIREDDLFEEPKEFFEPVCLEGAPKEMVRVPSRAPSLLTMSSTTATIEFTTIGATKGVTQG